MSYSIIFETKIVKLSDGRIIHFSRSGCNNDNEGRRKDGFSAKIYTEDAFVEMAEKYKKNSTPYKESGFMELKIGCSIATMYDYGEHLLRMLKRAKPYADFITENRFLAKHLTGVQLLSPEERMMTAAEFEKEFYTLLRAEGGLSYHYLFDYPDTKDETSLSRLIESGSTLSFYIKRKG